MNIKYIDVHCHPNLGELKKDQEAVIARMHEEGVLGIVVGVDLESSREAVALAQKYEHLFATVGLHPNYTQKETFDREAFTELLKQDKVVGAGECGIDYFRQSTTRAGEEAPEAWKEKQWEVFKQQVELAIEHDKPLMVHCRPSTHSTSSGQVSSMDAYNEILAYFEEKGESGKVKVRGNMHFFVGNVEVARRFWALGFTTSFTGVLTFTHDYDEVVREAPLNMILTETDAPYASPVPHRGEVNQPVYVRHVAEAIARIKGIPIEEVEAATLANAGRLFGPVMKPRIA